MKYISVIVLLVLFSVNPDAKAQIRWLDNINDAVRVADQTNKLIFVDFWASWCGPCRQMDGDVWSTETMQRLSDRFIFAKVDIDYNRTDATAYNIKSIPAMVIIDIEENKYVEIVGYKDLTYMLNLLGSFPDNMGEVYKRIAETRENDDWQHHVDVGLAFIDYSRMIENASVRNGFVEAAQGHFSSAGKQVKDDPAKTEMIELYEILAMSRYNPKRALKKLDKLYEDHTGANEDLFNYVYCCGLLESGDKTEARRYYDAVASSEREDLMSDLNQLMKNE